MSCDVWRVTVSPGAKNTPLVCVRLHTCVCAPSYVCMQREARGGPAEAHNRFIDDGKTNESHLRAARGNNEPQSVPEKLSR